ncbi:MAG: hypothetical protein JW839_01350 [Candidatus Lokiarchaeota archaeon]|nr:hypothetical protein [Candidatus Lokiarchaeota archaeon]
MVGHEGTMCNGFVATPTGIYLQEGDERAGILGCPDGSGPLSFKGTRVAPGHELAFVERVGETCSYAVDDGRVAVDLGIGARGTDGFHFAFKVTPARALAAGTIEAGFDVLLGGDPDFTWIPHVCPAPGLVVADHVFRSPVIVYKKGRCAFALVPDLDLFTADRRFPQFMDMDLRKAGERGAPRVVLGFGHYRPTDHVLFEADGRRRLHLRAGESVVLAFHVLVFKDGSVDTILQRVNKFLWDGYGAKLLRSSLAPQVLPFEVNVREGFAAIFDRHKLWQDFQVGGRDCGGSWQASWMGARKARMTHADPATFDAGKQMGKNMTRLVNRDSLLSKIIMYFSSKPFWIKAFDSLTRALPIVARNAEVWNNAWFMNVRTAYALAHFGKSWSDPVLTDKARRALELVLSLPRERGLFPTIVLPAKPGGAGYSEIKGVRGFHYVDEYNVVDNSLTMYWALKLYQDHFQDDRVLARARELVDLVVAIQRDDGEIPAYLSAQGQGGGKGLVPNGYLAGSASSGAPLMLLCEYCKHGNDKAVLDAARRIAGYLMSNVLPADKWHDFEPFYSCTNLPLDFYDARTGSHVMNALCIYWCAEGMKELYTLTLDPRYLEAGEHALAVLSLFQQVWRMPHLSFNAFGGFCSQNADAELNDARQGLFVRVYMEYYLVTGKREYMERGIAAMRACWATQLLRELGAECPGSIKGIKTVDDVDRGMVCENYGHSGHDLRVPGYVMPDWGVGTGASAFAYVQRNFGDMFVDFKEGIVWGIDGILVKRASIAGNQVSIECTIIDGKHQAVIKGRRAPGGDVELLVNGARAAITPGAELEKGFVLKLQLIAAKTVEV